MGCCKNPFNPLPILLCKSIICLGCYDEKKNSNSNCWLIDNLETSYTHLFASLRKAPEKRFFFNESNHLMCLCENILITAKMICNYFFSLFGFVCRFGVPNSNWKQSSPISFSIYKNANFIRVWKRWNYMLSNSSLLKRCGTTLYRKGKLKVTQQEIYKKENASFGSDTYF